MELNQLISWGPIVASWINGQEAQFDSHGEKLPLNFLIVMPDGKTVSSSKFQVSSSNGSNQNQSIYDSVPKGSLAIIPLKGEMVKESDWCNYGTQEIAALMMEAADHENIAGIILDVDSGGGAVDAVAPMLDAIKYSQAKGKPVVSIADTMASAAYWVGSATNEIIAGNNICALFGSIGVVCSFTDIQPYYEKMGIKFHTVYAPESTDKNTWFDDALKGDYTKLQNEILSPLAQSFQKAIKTNRPGMDQNVPGILNGKTFYAKDALKNGLIDQIGSMDMAITRAQQMAKMMKNNMNPNTNSSSKNSSINLIIIQQ
jgi:protease IV